MPKTKISLKDIIVEWLKSSDDLKVFRVSKNAMTNPAEARWHIWYHVWAQLEIKHDRLHKHGTDLEILAADPKFFEKTKQYLLSQKRHEDAWLAKRGRQVPKY